MSRLTYGIQIWGLSINKHLWKKIQRVQNLVMCWVLSRPFWTKITGLLDEMNWLSMFELSCYHSLLLLWKLKIIRLRTITFFKNIEKSKNSIGKIQLTRKIWSVRAIELYDELSLEISKCDKISILKSYLKMDENKHSNWRKWLVMTF